MHSCCQLCLLWLWIIGHIGLNEKNENHKFLLELFWLLQHAALELICYYLAISMWGSKMAPSKQDRWLPNCSALDFTILEVEIRAGKIGQKWEWKKRMDVFTDSRVHLHIVFFLSLRDMSGFGARQYVFFGLQTLKKMRAMEIFGKVKLLRDTRRG